MFQTTNQNKTTYTIFHLPPFWMGICPDFLTCWRYTPHRKTSAEGLPLDPLQLAAATWRFQLSSATKNRLVRWNPQGFNKTPKSSIGRWNSHSHPWGTIDGNPQLEDSEVFTAIRQWFEQISSVPEMRNTTSMTQNMSPDIHGVPWVSRGRIFLQLTRLFFGGLSAACVAVLDPFVRVSCKPDARCWHTHDLTAPENGNHFE